MTCKINKATAVQELKDFDKFRILLDKTRLVLEEDPLFNVLVKTIDTGIEIGFKVGKSVSSFLESGAIKEFINRNIPNIKEQLEKTKKNENVSK